MSVNRKANQLMWSIHIMESYTAKKMKKIHTITWMNLINTMLNKKTSYKINAI